MIIGNSFLGGMSDGSRIVRSFPMNCEAVVFRIILINAMVECSNELHVATVLEEWELGAFFSETGCWRSKLCSDPAILVSLLWRRSDFDQPVEVSAWYICLILRGIEKGIQFQVGVEYRSKELSCISLVGGLCWISDLFEAQTQWASLFLM